MSASIFTDTYLILIAASVGGHDATLTHDRLRGESETIGERLQRDLAAMRALPASPFDACDQASAKVTAQSLVRYKTNDYSVPAAFGHQDVWIQGYVDEVVIGCRGEIIARHPRSWGREDVVFDPLHYLGAAQDVFLIER